MSDHQQQVVEKACRSASLLRMSGLLAPSSSSYWSRPESHLHLFVRRSLMNVSGEKLRFQSLAKGGELTRRYLIITLGWQKAKHGVSRRVWAGKYQASNLRLGGWDAPEGEIDEGGRVRDKVVGICAIDSACPSSLSALNRRKVRWTRLRQPRRKPKRCQQAK